MDRGFTLLEMLITLLIINLGLIVLSEGRSTTYHLQQQQHQQFKQVLLEITKQSITDVANAFMSDTQLQQLLESSADCNVTPAVNCNVNISCSHEAWAILEHWEASCQN